jgi:putative transcriptional regulator
MSSLAGTFLVAKSVLKDPHFGQSVVLMLQHGDEGALGLIVNKPADLEGLPFPLFAGGPCQAPGLLMLHGHGDWTNQETDGEREIAPGIFLGDNSCVKQVNDEEKNASLRFRIFRGYAGWGPGQLEGEMAAGAWAIVPANGDVLFDTPADDLWDRLVPPAIPQPSVN